MNCEQVKELLSAYLDNMLAAEERQVVAAHLQTCTECHSLLADFQRFDTLLSHLPRVSPPLTLREKIFSASALLKSAPESRHRAGWGERILYVLIAASIVLTLGVGSLIAWNIQREQITSSPDGITPPTGPQVGPIPAGTRFVFLHNGALWSAPTDGSTGIVRLTPQHVTVAPNWVVRAPLPGRSVGNMLAYIDLQRGYVHTIRSDGQNDTIVQQPLLQTGVTPASVWDSATGAAILSSLSWSKDGSMLAFVAATKGTGLPGLSLYSTGTGKVHEVPLPRRGTVSQPVWSPDSIRIAFKVMHEGKTGILDYNTQSNAVITLIATVHTSEHPAATVLTLGWSPDTTAPAITWSVGSNGQVHSIWSRQVGGESAVGAVRLTYGDYSEATYSQVGSNGQGGWLLVNAQAGLLSVDLHASVKLLTNGKQASFARWSPDGTRVSFFDKRSSDSGAFHIMHITSGNDTLVAANATVNPVPAWSPDSQRLAYSAGSHVLVVHIQNSKISRPLKLQGSATVLCWSATTPDQLVLVLNNGQQGIYLVDTQDETSQQLAKDDIQSRIQWTQIP